MQNLAIEKDSCLRAIGIAAIGARRLDPGEALSGIAELRQVLPRFRAYRTTGQLGRADLMAQLRPGLTDPDPECRFWSAWAAARMGATEPLDILADIAWNNLPRADRALDLLLRRLDVPQANAWLREFAKLPDRQRALIRATGVIGDPLYIPWLIEHMADPATARLAGESFSMITGLDLAYRDLDRRPPADFQSGPNDDPADENVSLDEDENLPWPDPERIGQWWTANRSRFSRRNGVFPRHAQSIGRLAGGAVRRLPAPAPCRRARTRHPPARQGDVRGPCPRPPATPADRPRPRVGVAADQGRSSM